MSTNWLLIIFSEVTTTSLSPFYNRWGNCALEEANKLAKVMCFISRELTDSNPECTWVPHLYLHTPTALPPLFPPEATVSNSLSSTDFFPVGRLLSHKVAWSPRNLSFPLSSILHISALPATQGDHLIWRKGRWNWVRRLDNSLSRRESRKMKGASFIGCFSHFCDMTPNKKHFQKRRFEVFFLHFSGIYFIMVEEAQHQEWKARWSHCIHSLESEDQ